MHDEQYIVFDSDGSMATVTSKPVVLVDSAELSDLWRITLDLHKAGGTVKLSGIIKSNNQ